MKAAVIGLLLLASMAVTADLAAQRPPTGPHAIYMTAVEFKGSSTADKLLPPPVDPTRISRGYVCKAPGQADPSDPAMGSGDVPVQPAFMTVQQWDSVMLSVFIANGDHREVVLSDPEGEKIIDRRAWDRGRECTAFLQVRKAGTYRLECGIHGPSIAATTLVLPRERPATTP